MNAHSETLQPRRSRTRSRLAAIGVGAALAGATMLVAGPASAAVNPIGADTQTWGDCTVTTGNVRQTDASAVGGMDVSCTYAPGTITAKVDLYRFDGSQWVLVRTSDWYTIDGSSGLSVWTGAYCGGGLAYWKEIGTVWVDGSTTAFDTWEDGTNQSAYAPGGVC